MSLRETVMYRVICDEPGCEASPQDGGEFYAWADTGMPYDEAMEAGWTTRPHLDLCPDHGHRTVCMGDDAECPRRDSLTQGDDGWVYCPEHLEQGAAEGGAA